MRSQLWSLTGSSSLAMEYSHILPKVSAMRGFLTAVRLLCIPCSAGVRNSDDSASVAAAGAAAAAAAPSAFDLPESGRILQLLAQQVLPSTSQPEERTRNSPSQASPAAAAATSGAELVLDAQLDARLFTPLLQAVRAGDIELYQALLGHKLLCGRLRSQRTAGSKK
eukprot:4938-Heterococcus_DN1.PRE.3